VLVRRRLCRLGSKEHGLPLELLWEPVGRPSLPVRGYILYDGYIFIQYCMTYLYRGVCICISWDTHPVSTEMCGGFGALSLLKLGCQPPPTPLAPPLPANMSAVQSVAVIGQLGGCGASNGSGCTAKVYLYLCCD
jgi:hypothetical protein